MARVFLIILDGFGIGAMPDANEYGDVGTNTLRSVAKSHLFAMPHMRRLGLFNIDGVKELPAVDNPAGYFARLGEASKGKDTIVGHWELAGLISPQPLPLYPHGFPEEVLDEFSAATGRGYLCNLPYSGTDVIRDYGCRHLAEGKLIVYTSADSVFQIAAHEKIVPLDELYRYCQIARRILVGEHGVGRVIARPFSGDDGNFYRTSGRHDYSLSPPGTTMLEIIIAAGLDVIGIGKIADIFGETQVTRSLTTKSNEEGEVATLATMREDFHGLCFTNLVDFDMLYGHRNDSDGFARALSAFDEKLPELLSLLRADDLLMITADHGCDPGYLETTDHSREYVPFVMYGHGLGGSDTNRCELGSGNLGTRETFADVAATVLSFLGLQNETRKIAGKSMI
ncbi:MAG: phosphopentomutase [Lachnospiraceae bacterium]|jgi:phosphopentomutase|nr:phosphopentomutase [Lachnospiraceae bacterium]